MAGFFQTNLYMSEDTPELEIVSSSAISAIERAQIDTQIATARQWPRNLAKVKDKMLSFATLDEDTAASCFYTLPARKGGDGKALQGPSVRMAEIALACYQHIKAGSRIISDDGKFITAQACVHDLENNVAIAIEVQRRVTNRDGKRYSDDMIATTGNAACSIALRNATFRVVPRALITPVYEAAKKVAVGEVKSLTVKRAKVIDRLKHAGATEDRIFAAVGVTKAEEIDLEKLETLIGLGTAMKDGTVSLEEAFPGPEPKQEAAPEFKPRKPKQEPPPAPATNFPAADASPQTVLEVPTANVDGGGSTSEALPSAAHVALRATMDKLGANFGDLRQLCAEIPNFRGYITDEAAGLSGITEANVTELLRRPKLLGDMLTIAVKNRTEKEGGAK